MHDNNYQRAGLPIVLNQMLIIIKHSPTKPLIFFSTAFLQLITHWQKNIMGEID